MKKEDIHLKPLTSGEALNHIPYIPKSVAGATRRSFTLTLKRCGVRDTVASVPVPFCFFFLRLKKEDNGQPRTSVPTVRKQAFISLIPKERCGRDALSKQSGGLFVAKAGSNL